MEAHALALNARALRRRLASRAYRVTLRGAPTDHDWSKELKTLSVPTPVMAIAPRSSCKD
jgi:hypothetical protein